MTKNGQWRLMVIFLVITGCATVPVYTSDPTTHTVENEFFVAELESQHAPGKHYFDSFRYLFTNKSKTDLQIDWQNTFYLKNGQKFGRWAVEGMTLEQLQETRKHPLITVPPGNTRSGLIFPLRLIARPNFTEIARDYSKSRGIIPEGENGMLLTVRQGDRVIREELNFKIAITQMTK